MSTACTSERSIPLSDRHHAPAHLALLEAHVAGEDALQRVDPAYVDGIAWLSAHLAALEVVVYPAAARSRAACAEAVAQAARTREVLARLRLLHAHLAGDSAAAGLDLARLRAALLTRLAEHRDGEQRLLECLSQALPPAEWERLARSYERALALPITRPHPHALHAGPASRAVHHVLSVVDRVLDVLDARPVHRLPAPRDVEVVEPATPDAA